LIRWLFGFLTAETMRMLRPIHASKLESSGLSLISAGLPISALRNEINHFLKHQNCIGRGGQGEAFGQYIVGFEANISRGMLRPYS
jgi:hypothetical protein